MKQNYHKKVSFPFFANRCQLLVHQLDYQLCFSFYNIWSFCLASKDDDIVVFGFARIWFSYRWFREARSIGADQLRVVVGNGDERLGRKGKRINLEFTFYLEQSSYMVLLNL